MENKNNWHYMNSMNETEIALTNKSYLNSMLQRDTFILEIIKKWKAIRVSIF